MRKSTSLTIEEEHLTRLDAGKDKYDSRSDYLNKILDEYFTQKKVLYVTGGVVQDDGEPTYP